MIAELYGGAWSNRKAGKAAPAGRLHRVPSGHPFGILADLHHTWVTTDPEVAVFGYVCVYSKVHAVEPFEFPDRGRPFGGRRWPWPRWSTGCIGR